MAFDPTQYELDQYGRPYNPTQSGLEKAYIESQGQPALPPDVVVEGPQDYVPKDEQSLLFPKGLPDELHQGGLAQLAQASRMDDAGTPPAPQAPQETVPQQTPSTLGKTYYNDNQAAIQKTNSKIRNKDAIKSIAKSVGKIVAMVAGGAAGAGAGGAAGAAPGVGEAADVSAMGGAGDLGVAGAGAGEGGVGTAPSFASGGDTGGMGGGMLNKLASQYGYNADTGEIDYMKMGKSALKAASGGPVESSTVKNTGIGGSPQTQTAEGSEQYAGIGGLLNFIDMAGGGQKGKGWAQMILNQQPTMRSGDIEWA